MNSKEYAKIMIEKLIKKHNNRLARKSDTNRRIILKATEVYRKYADNNADIIEKQNLDEAVEMLLGMEIITVERLKFSLDIEKIYLCEENIGRAYDYLEEKYGIAPQNVLREQAGKMIAQYNDTAKLVKTYRDSLKQQMENPQYRIDLERMEANFKILRFLERNEEDLYLREVSMLVYGDSKWLKENNYDEVCGIVRKMLGIPKEEDESMDDLLLRYHVIPAEQEICIKGNWRIEWEDNVLEIKKQKGGISLAWSDVRDVKRIMVRASSFMTIENKTSYQRMTQDDMAMMYLGGFANRHQIQFLKRVLQDNPELRCYHFGDIDVGGFLIHRHLCHATGISFELYCMGIRQLQDRRFQSCIKKLTDNDVSRMELLLHEDKYAAVAKYMKENDAKLEQEIVSYYISKEGYPPEKVV